MKRELSYREEMVQQLHIVRGERNKAEGADAAVWIHRFTHVMDDGIYAQNPLCIFDIKDWPELSAGCNLLCKIR